MKIRSKKYTDMLRRTLFVIAILTGTVSLPSLVWGQTNRHAGGKNDGYTRGCVPPVIQSVRGLKTEGVSRTEICIYLCRLRGPM